MDSVNQVSTNQIMEFVSNITNARPKSGFDKGALERLEQLFKETVGDDKEIRRADFNKICQSKNVSELIRSPLQIIFLFINSEKFSPFSANESFKSSTRTTLAQFRFKNS